MAACDVCFRHCVIPEGERGFCGARTCVNGRVIAENYGRIRLAVTVEHAMVIDTAVEMILQMPALSGKLRGGRQIAFVCRCSRD